RGTPLTHYIYSLSARRYTLLLVGPPNWPRHRLVGLREQGKYKMGKGARVLEDGARLVGEERKPLYG
ncbi:hypothetical protein BHM03_00058234, partial [Ensete ventricosum]